MARRQDGKRLQAETVDRSARPHGNPGVVLVRRAMRSRPAGSPRTDYHGAVPEMLV